MSEENDSTEQGVGNDDDLIEPNKAKHKIIRVLTVIAYTLSVSMAAILLSIYYVFMWDGHPTLARKDPSRSPHLPMAQHHQQPLLQPSLPISAAYTMSTSGTTKLDKLLIGSDIFDNLTEHDESNEENVLVDVPYEPTAIPVVEAKTEAPPPSTPEPFDEDNSNDNDWPMNITSYSNLPELTKRSPMFKKLIMSSVVD